MSIIIPALIGLFPAALGYELRHPLLGMAAGVAVTILACLWCIWRSLRDLGL
jgi:hypothetical protein